MKTLVTGGTGFIGGHLCRELDERGHDVTALSRDPDGAELPSSVAFAEGDVTTYESIVAAFEGQDAVVQLVSLSPLFKPDGGDQMHDLVHRKGTENCLRAADEHGVERFVQMSGLGADPNGETAFIRAKGRAEESVKESGREWVIFRPSVVFGEGGEFVYFTKYLKKTFAPGVPLYPLPGGGKTPFQPIWIGDLVPMLAEAVEEDEHVGRTYHVGGPEVLTLREITNIVYDAEGKSVSVVPLPMGLAKIGLSVLGSVGFSLGPDQYRSLKLDHTTPDNDVETFGRDEASLKSLSTYLSGR